MPRIRIVTDSAADLDRQVASDHGVSIVRLDVRLGEFGPDVTSTWSPEEFWQMCAKIPELAETSAPSPGAFSEVFSSSGGRGRRGNRLRHLVLQAVGHLPGCRARGRTRRGS